MNHNSYSMVGAGPVVIRKFLLTENAEFTIPENANLLYSELVQDSSGETLLEAWYAVPTTPTGQEPQTIYTNTTIRETPQLSEIDPDDPDYIEEEEYYYD